MKLLCIVLLCLSQLAQAQEIDNIVTAVNAIRKNGCYCGGEWFKPAPPLVWSNQLYTAAQLHAKYMLSQKKMSHTGQGRTNVGQRIINAGYNWTFAAENVAYGYLNFPQAFQGWLKSPGHCENIMNPKIKHIGVAFAGEYWAMDLARPMPMP